MSQALINNHPSIHAWLPQCMHHSNMYPKLTWTCPVPKTHRSTQCHQCQLQVRVHDTLCMCIQVALTSTTLVRSLDWTLSLISHSRELVYPELVFLPHPPPPPRAPISSHPPPPSDPVDCCLLLLLSLFVMSLLMLLLMESAPLTLLVFKHSSTGCGCLDRIRRQEQLHQHQAQHLLRPQPTLAGP
jgi:hypothetical protein